MSHAATEVLPGSVPTLSTLKDLVGAPARLSLQDPTNPHSVVRIPGTLREVSPTGLLVDILFVLPSNHSNQPVLLEMMTTNSLYQCCTFIIRTPSPLTAFLHFPSDVHPTDRRHHPRFKVNIETELITGNRDYPVRIQNLSLSGCAVAIGKQLRLGTQVTLAVAPLGLTPSTVEAKVVRASLTPVGIWEIGLQFLQLSTLQQEQLALYIDHTEVH